MDFNKIGYNNGNYGKEAVSYAMKKAVHEVINKINNLSNGSFIPIRMGGDEFCFIVLGQDVSQSYINDEIQKLVQNSTKSIDEDQTEIPDGLTATCVSTFFDKDDDLLSLYNTLSVECTNKKERQISKIFEIFRIYKGKNEIKDNNKILYALLTVIESFSEFDFNAVDELIENEQNADDIIYGKIDEKILEALSSYDDISEEEIECIKQIIYKTREKFLKLKKDKNQDSEILINNNTDDFCVKSFEELRDKMLAFTTNVFNMPKFSYFFKHTFPTIKDNSKYRLITIEFTHLKSCNSNHGVIKTDEFLYELHEKVQEKFEEDCFFGSLKGGRLMIFCPYDDEKTKDILNEISEDVNNFYIPLGFESNVYKLPDSFNGSWTLDDLINVRQIFEESQAFAKSEFNICDLNVQETIADFFSKHLFELEKRNKRKPGIIEAGVNLYEYILNLSGYEEICEL